MTNQGGDAFKPGDRPFKEPQTIAEVKDRLQTLAAKTQRLIDSGQDRTKDGRELLKEMREEQRKLDIAGQRLGTVQAEVVSSSDASVEKKPVSLGAAASGESPNGERLDVERKFEEIRQAYEDMRGALLGVVEKVLGRSRDDANFIKFLASIDPANPASTYELQNSLTPFMGAIGGAATAVNMDDEYYRGGRATPEQKRKTVEDTSLAGTYLRNESRLRELLTQQPASAPPRPEPKTFVPPPAPEQISQPTPEVSVADELEVLRRKANESAASRSPLPEQAPVATPLSQEPETPQPSAERTDTDSRTTTTPSESGSATATRSTRESLRQRATRKAEGIGESFWARRQERAKPVGEQIRAAQPLREQALQEAGWTLRQIEEYFTALGEEKLGLDAHFSGYDFLESIRDGSILGVRSREARIINAGNKIFFKFLKPRLAKQARTERTQRRREQAERNRREAGIKAAAKEAVEQQAYIEKMDARAEKGVGKLTAVELEAFDEAVRTRKALADGTVFNKDDARNYAAMLGGLFGRTGGKIGLTEERKRIRARAREILLPIWRRQYIDRRRVARDQTKQELKGAARAIGRGLGSVTVRPARALLNKISFDKDLVRKLDPSTMRWLPQPEFKHKIRGSEYPFGIDKSDIPAGSPSGARALYRVQRVDLRKIYAGELDSVYISERDTPRGIRFSVHARRHSRKESVIGKVTRELTSIEEAKRAAAAELMK